MIADEDFVDFYNQSLTHEGIDFNQEEEVFPTFAEELEKMEQTMPSFGGSDSSDFEVQVLHNLLLKAAAAKKDMEEALQLTGVDQDQMESIFADHDDLAEDVVSAFEDVEEHNQQLGEEIVRFLQDHLVEEEDGSYRYQSSAPDPVEEMKKTRRLRDEKRNARWENYYYEREVLPQKLREHQAFLQRHLTENLEVSEEECYEDEGLARCYSEKLEEYQANITELVTVLEAELHPFTSVLDTLGEATTKVRKAAGSIGTLSTIFGILKKMGGVFGAIFGVAHQLFDKLDTGADPVEDAIDDFEDYVLGIWENTAGAALTKMYEFEAIFSQSVALFSFAADATRIPALPGLVKGLIGVDLEHFNNSVQTVEQHVEVVLGQLKSLMTAFEDNVFLNFHTKAQAFIDAIAEIDVFMDAFAFVEDAYNYQIELPFGMPRTLMSRKLGRASCDPHQNRYTRPGLYSGAKQFDLMAPWNVACKERCPSGFDTLSGGQRCRRQCASYGLSKHLVFGIQDGCLRQSRDKPLRSLPVTRKCKNKIGSSWYRNFPTDRCRQHCGSWLGHGNYFGYFYGRCTMNCPSGLENHPVFRDKACKIPDSAKFDRTKLDASCNAYTNNGQLDVYLKNTGGCYEDCKSNE